MVTLKRFPDRTLTVLRHEAASARAGTMSVSGVDIDMAELLEDAAVEIEALRRSVDRKQQQYERSQRYWVDAAQKALTGDSEHLRLRVDMALAGPIEMTETA